MKPVLKGEVTQEDKKGTPYTVGEARIALSLFKSDRIDPYFIALYEFLLSEAEKYETSTQR